MIECIVCKNKKIELFKIIHEKKYWHCINCEAKFLDKKNYIDAINEKKHYLKHNNFIKDPGYRKFLSRLSEPLKKYISINDSGLDYGCGYAPALADIFKEDGFAIDIYDPFFFPNDNLFLNKYNFITCSEVVEHLFNPYDEFFKLDALLENNGYLGVMTSLMPSDQEFENWYYRRDPTHVVFYNEKTFEVIASQMNWNLIIPSKDIAIFKK
jgi:hypothetical protein